MGLNSMESEVEGRQQAVVHVLEHSHGPSKKPLSSCAPLTSPPDLSQFTPLPISLPHLTPKWDVGFSFAKPGTGWLHSCLGYHLRCMLVCEVDDDIASPSRSAPDG